jgi:hypothetical protein
MSGDLPDVRGRFAAQHGSQIKQRAMTRPQPKGPFMNTYAIRRKQAWGSPEELQAVAARSKSVADDEFPADIRWIRSYVLAEPDGTLGSVCIYQATSPEAIRRHAQRVGMPADEIHDVADTVVIRPDPVAEVATA